jgi:hypothetical protein
MKKLYYLDESEKERILNMHKQATKNNYLLSENKSDELILEANPIVTLFDYIGSFRNLLKRKKISKAGMNRAILDKLKASKIVDDNDMIHLIVKDGNEYKVKSMYFDVDNPPKEDLSRILDVDSYEKHKDGLLDGSIKIFYDSKKKKYEYFDGNTAKRKILNKKTSKDIKAAEELAKKEFKSGKLKTELVVASRWFIKGNLVVWVGLPLATTIAVFAWMYGEFLYNNLMTMPTWIREFFNGARTNRAKFLELCRQFSDNIKNDGTSRFDNMEVTKVWVDTFVNTVKEKKINEAKKLIEGITSPDELFELLRYIYTDNEGDSYMIFDWLYSNTKNANQFNNIVAPLLDKMASWSNAVNNTDVKKSLLQVLNADERFYNKTRNTEIVENIDKNIPCLFPIMLDTKSKGIRLEIRLLPITDEKVINDVTVTEEIYFPLFINKKKFVSEFGYLGDIKDWDKLDQDFADITENYKRCEKLGSDAQLDNNWELGLKCSTIIQRLDNVTGEVTAFHKNIQKSNWDCSQMVEFI